MLTVPTIARALHSHVPLRLEASRYAAVALLLVGAEDPEVLLIRRAEHDRDPWSGQMAFPGGRHEPGDEQLVHTAIRETREEVGVSLSTNDLLGELDDVRAVSRRRTTDMVIRPFVFSLDRRPHTTPDHVEVASVVWARANQLGSEASRSSFRLEHEGRRYVMPAFDVDGHTVWGLTHRMLQSLIDVARGTALATQAERSDPRTAPR